MTENHNMQRGPIGHVPSGNDEPAKRPLWRRPVVTKITLKETLVGPGSFTDGPINTTSP